MARRALLVCCPNTPGQTALPGAQLDYEKYRSYLMSRVGGGWTNHEIISLVDEQRQAVLDTVHACDNMDYVFVLFSGHGSHPAGNPDPLASRVRLTGGTLTVDQLDPQNGRSTIIVDSCRTPATVGPRTEQYLAEHAVVAARAPVRPPLAEYRDAFNEAVARCPEQTVYLFGCSVGETAKDDANEGGLFPQALRSRAIAWERRRGVNRNATLRLDLLQFSARAKTLWDSQLQQHPRMHRVGPAGGLHFPFAVYRAV